MTMESSKLYHMVPKKMEGNILFPLNKLPEKLGDAGEVVYQEEVKKYSDTNGREDLMKKIIPDLDNAKWNDVIHLTPIHPKIIRDAIKETLKKIGKGRDLPHWDYFEIDPSVLNFQNTVVYLGKDKPISEEFSQEDFEQFDPSNLEKYSHLPNETLAHYEESIVKNNKMPTLYHLTPHILTKDSIDIRNSKIISTKDFEK